MCGGIPPAWKQSTGQLLTDIDRIYNVLPLLADLRSLALFNTSYENNHGKRCGMR